MATAKQARNRHAPHIRIEVTPEIIAASTARDSSHCMIAEALRAAYPLARNVAVDLQTIRLTDPAKGLRYTYLTPRTGQIALVDFDQGRLPEPFGMTLRGGQVTVAGYRRPRTPDQAEREKALRKARLVRPVNDGGERTGVPEKMGGRTPPLSGFARRRAFGIRGLDR
jgi:hypothetical protein